VSSRRTAPQVQPRAAVNIPSPARNQPMSIWNVSDRSDTKSCRVGLQPAGHGTASLIFVNEITILIMLKGWNQDTAKVILCRPREM